MCEAVHSCENLLTAEIMAVKILDRGKLKFFQRKRYQIEVEILKRLDHPNIIRFEHYFCTKSRYFIVTEMAKGLELFHLLNKMKKIHRGKEKLQKQSQLT